MLRRRSLFGFVAAGVLACSGPRDDQTVFPVPDVATPGDALSDLTVPGDNAELYDAVETDVPAPTDVENAPEDSQLSELLDMPGPDAADLAETAEILDAEVAPDVPSDAGSDAADTAPQGVVSPAPTWTAAFGCAYPVPWIPPACEGKTCPTGTVCMGTHGLCLPDSPQLLPAPIGTAHSPALATRADGAWALANSTGVWPKGSLYLQVFPGGDLAGLPPVLLSGGLPGHHFGSAVTRLADGSWLVAWRMQDEATQTIAYYLRRVAADGSTVLGEPRQLNTTPLGLGESSGPSNIVAPVLVRTRDDGVLAAWAGGAKGQGIKLGIYLRRYNGEGEAPSGELDTGTVVQGQRVMSPAIAPLALGRAALAWEMWPDGKQGDPFAQGRVFETTGEPSGAAFALSPKVKIYEALPGLAAFDDDSLLVTWKSGSVKEKTDAVKVFARRVAAGSPPGSFGTTHLLDQDGTGQYPGQAPVAVAHDGRAIVAWHNATQPKHAVRLNRYYPADDAFDCAPTDVAGSLAGTGAPVVATFPDGRILVAWNTQVVPAPGEVAVSRIAVRFFGW